jgi:hypothetical protein
MFPTHFSCLFSVKCSVNIEQNQNRNHEITRNKTKRNRFHAKLAKDAKKTQSPNPQQCEITRTTNNDPRTIQFSKSANYQRAERLSGEEISSYHSTHKYQSTRYSQLSAFGLTFQICEMYEDDRIGCRFREDFSDPGVPRFANNTEPKKGELHVLHVGPRVLLGLLFFSR